jgi:flagellar assembly protein FliH
LEYLNEKKIGSDFRMNDVIRVQTGVDSLEKKTEEQKVDEQALEKLQVIQESAYAEAYRLGLDEGKKSAFDKASREIEERLTDLDQLLDTIKNLRTELAAHNETSLIGLMFQMASR